MTTTPSRFKDVDLRQAFAAVDDHAEKHGVPDLTFPDGKGTADVVPINGAPTLADVTTPAPKAPIKPASLRKAKKQTQIEEEGPAVRRMTVDLPAYLFSAIYRRGFEQGACAKYVILQALHSDGFEIKPEDMTKDGRRVRKDASHAA